MKLERVRHIQWHYEQRKSAVKYCHYVFFLSVSAMQEGSVDFMGNRNLIPFTLVFNHEKIYPDYFYSL